MSPARDDSPGALAATESDPKVALGETALASTGPTAVSPAHLTAGAKIGRYTIAGTLGSGGMGIVYRAFDPQLGRPIALKVVRPVVASPESQARLIREAQAMAKVTHPNVITVHDAGAIDEHVFVAMELVDGMDLAHWLDAQPRGWRDVVAMFEQAGKGLAAAHEAGLVHRDFKPLNVMVGKDRRVRVLDFGLARSVETPVDAAATTLPPGSNELMSLTHTGAVLGTPRYMAAEQHAGGETDGRTDQFAFCVALHLALYRTYPFAGDTVPELMANVIEGNVRPYPPAAKVPGWLGRIVRRGLSVRPDARFPTMGALLDEIQRGVHRARRTRWIGAAVGGVIACAIAIVVLRSPPEGAPATFPAATQQQVTFTGAAIQPALSSDGRRLAFANNGEDVVVQDFENGQIRIVHTTPAILSIQWSPTDRELLVASADGLTIVPLDGSRVRTLVTCPFAAWSPDGSEIAMHCAPAGPLVFYNAKTWAERTVKVDLPGVVWFLGIDWSGTTNKLLVLTEQQRGVSLWTLEPSGANLREIYHDALGLIDAQANRLTVRWNADGTRIYLARRREQTIELGVLAYDAVAKVAREGKAPLAGIPLDGAVFAVSRDERSVVVSRTSSFSKIEAVVGARELTLASDALDKGHLALSPDETLLAFTSGAGTRLRIHIVPMDGGPPTIVPASNMAISDLAWSPDGTEILYAVSRDRTPGLWRLNVATKQSVEIPAPDISETADVAWLEPNVVMYQVSGNRNFAIANLVTGDRRLLVADPSHGWMFGPVASPDGRQLVATWTRDNNSPWLFSLDRDQTTQLDTVDMIPAGWSRDGRSVYLADLAQRPRVFAIDVATRAIRVVRDAPDGASAAVASDGAAAFLTVKDVSDLWLATTDQQRRPVALPAPLETSPPEVIPTLPAQTNLGMEDGEAGSIPTGWFVPRSTDATVAISDRQPREGKHALRIQTRTRGAVTQRFDATPFRGARVRFGIQIRAVGAEVTIGVATVIGDTTKTAGQATTKPSEWKSLIAIADIRPDAEQIEISIDVPGPGEVWIDDGSFAVVSE